MNSLKYRFISILLFIFVSIIVFLINDSRILSEIDANHARILHIKEVQIQLLQMRRAEKDFFARHNIKYYNKLQNLYTISSKDFMQLGLEKEIQTYIDSFTTIGIHMKRLGLDNFQGLKKQFIFHTNRLERDLTEDNHTNILIQFLMMRKYEKDFFIHKDTKYLKLRRNMIKAMKRDIRLKGHTDILIDNYNLAFIDLKTEMLLIGLNEKLGLHAVMRTASHTVENKLTLYIQEELPLIESELKNLKQIRYIIYFLLLSAILILFVVLLRPIYKALHYFKEFFIHFSNAKERLDLDTIKFTELKEIASIVNTMLQSRDVFEDDLIKTKDEAIRLQKVKEEFLTNMSHELRTPLNAIIGFSSILEKKFPDENKLIYPISNSSKHLLEIINDILDISKIQNGNFSINASEFNLKEKIEICHSRFDFNTTTKNITFSVKFLASTTLLLHGDWLRISQVVSNFLSNSFKFTPENGSVCLTIDYKDSHLCISVKDTGIGISQEAQKRILNPFEQADSSTTKNFGGTGLGLSISNSIIELMHGTIFIHSKENEGSEFSFKIPLDEIKHDTIEDKPSEDEEETELNISAHILVVEDNKTNQMLLTMLLDDVGITFDVANDGLEAVHMYKDNTYNIVLMDENMPNLNGIGAMQKIRQEHVNVCPIIAVTANVMKGDEQRLLDAGMDGFVPKPIDDNELLETIQKFLKP